MTEYYLLLICLSVPILIFFVFLLTQKVLRKYLFIAIPIVLFLVFKLWYAVESIKSQPTENTPSEYILIDGIEVPMKAIYLWVSVKGQDNPITIKLPWSPKSSKELANAKQGMQEGKFYSNVNKTAETTGNGRGNASSNETDELKFYEFQLKDIQKKN